MLKNHLKLSLRNLWKNRLLSSLNLLGLSIGIGSVLTLFFSVYAYYTADSIIEDQENIYYLKTTTSTGASYNQTTYPLLDEIVNSSPEVIAGTHLFGGNSPWLEYGEVEFQEEVDYVEPEFFKVFSLPLKHGDAQTALQKKYSVILTHKVSQKIFGEVNPVGLTLKANDSLNLTVTGVFEPISPYSTFRFGVVMSTKLLEGTPNFKARSTWGNAFTITYLRLRPNTNITAFEKRVEGLVKKYNSNPTTIASITAMPFTGARTDSIPVVKIIINGCIAAAFFVLLIVLVNLLNLNTSTMFRRTKDIAVRKILGGSKKSVVFQFLLENGILVFSSILISGGIFLGLLMPKMNDVFGADFGRISFTVENDYPVILFAVGLGVLVTLILGVLPTLRFISIPVSTGIKGKMERMKSNFLIRNSFIIVQFTIAILFICIAIILNNQIGFMKNAELGFHRENIIVGNIDLEYKDIDKATLKFETLVNELNTNPYVKSVSVSNAVPSDYYNNFTTFYDAEADNDVRTRYASTDDHYLKTLEVQMIMGRDFDENIDKSEDFPAIINRTAMKALGWKTIEGKRLSYRNGNSNPVVGVMEDFHYRDLQNSVEPLVHFYKGKKDLTEHRFLSVSVIQGQEKDVQVIITNAFASIASRRNYEQTYLSDKVSGQYRLIDGMLKTVNVVALLTIFISCLGMFGLISFMAKRRIKEIGIRKVLGAGVLKIVILLSKDYIILVGIAALIAFPTAWYMMNMWLGSFAYSITIQWWMFAFGGLITLLITTFTLSIQAIKSATVNPVKSLRSE